MQHFQFRVHVFPGFPFPDNFAIAVEFKDDIAPDFPWNSDLDAALHQAAFHRKYAFG